MSNAQESAATDDAITSNLDTERPDTVETRDLSQMSAWDTPLTRQILDKLVSETRNNIQNFTSPQFDMSEFEELPRKGEIFSLIGGLKLLEKTLEDTKVKNFERLIASRCSSSVKSGETSPAPATRGQWIPKRERILQNARIDTRVWSFLHLSNQEVERKKPLRYLGPVLPTEIYQPRSLFEIVKDVAAFTEEDWMDKYRKEMAEEGKNLNVKPMRVIPSTASTIWSKLCCHEFVDELEQLAEHSD